MRAWKPILCLSLLAASCLPAASQGSAPSPTLRIAEVLADPDATPGQREFVEVWNAGNASANLQGWKLHDAPTASGSTNSFTFPAWSLPPNARVVVWGGGAADWRGPAWSNPTVGNNAGDAAFLLDPAGNVADWAGYGNAAAPPAAFAGRAVAADPPKGQSVQLDHGAWVVAAPSPGTALGAVGGGLVVNVTNAPPTAAFVGVPRSVRPGAALQVDVAVGDDNGPQDVRSWTLSSGDGVLASGSAASAQSVQLTAPTVEGPWTLSLSATDQAGATASANVTIAVRANPLAVLMPASQARFPAARPGGDGADVPAAASLRNDGDQPAVPLLDVSDFQAGGASFPAAGHVWVGLDDGTWIAYAGPLTPLPTLAPGQQVELSFRLRGIPSGLAAGSYGASFSVVAQ